VDSGVPKPTVSQICEQIDGHVEALRVRTLAVTSRRIDWSQKVAERAASLNHPRLVWQS
jgi:hypothetical protein